MKPKLVLLPHLLSPIGLCK